jgi:hypothetical protein
MRRHIFDIGRRPTPNNSNPILNILLMADMAIKLIMGTLFPSFPRGIHQMAGCAKSRIMLDIVIGPKAGKADPSKRDHENT